MLDRLQRVQITEDIDNFPDIYLKAGACGTVDHEDDERVMVRLDEHYRELSEWNNCIEIWKEKHNPLPLKLLRPMQVFYKSDGEPDTVFSLEDLLANFRDSETRHYPSDIRDDLNSRGWYEGTHDCGRYLILNLDRLNLTPRP